MTEGRVWEKGGESRGWHTQDHIGHSKGSRFYFTYVRVPLEGFVQRVIRYGGLWGKEQEQFNGCCIGLGDGCWQLGPG